MTHDLDQVLQQKPPSKATDLQILEGVLAKQNNLFWVSVDGQAQLWGPVIGGRDDLVGKRVVISISQKSKPYVVFPPPDVGRTASRVWTWTTSIATGSSAGKVGADASSWSAATHIQLSEEDKDGNDLTNLLTSIGVGDTLYLQDASNSANWGRYQVSGTPVDAGTYRNIPVTFISGGGSQPANNQDTQVVIDYGGGGGGGGSTDVDATASSTTLAPGSPATVTVTEPIPNTFAFAFGIPKGDPGSAGSGGKAFIATVGDGSNKAFNVFHNFGTKAINIDVFRTAAPYDRIIVDVERTDDNNITIRTVNVPAPNELTVMVSSAGDTGDYVFTQTAAAQIWDITHNLNRRPSVTVVDTGDNVLIPDVHYIDNNNLQVIFGAATSGKAYMN